MMSGIRIDRGGWRVVLGCAALVLLGIVVGGLFSSGSGAGATVTVTVSLPAPPARAGGKPGLRPVSVAGGGFGETAPGAVAAASAYLDELEGPALLSSARVSVVVEALAASAVRARLLAAYRAAAVQVDAQLGLGTVPAPVVIVRAVPVGYRLDRFGGGRAVVSVWRVGIVGSGATVAPEQSWRTETVSLVWEHGWRITSLASDPGPTPPLAGSTVSTPGELFASIPEFETFSHVRP
jgi:hypothetical protein